MLPLLPWVEQWDDRGYGGESMFVLANGRLRCDLAGRNLNSESEGWVPSDTMTTAFFKSWRGFCCVPLLLQTFIICDNIDFFLFEVKP